MNTYIKKKNQNHRLMKNDLKLQGGQKKGVKNAIKSESVKEIEKCDNLPELTLKMEVKEEPQPTSEQAQS